MMGDKPGSLAHSVQARLKNLARSEGRIYQELLIRHGLERFLYRLSRTSQRDNFILKGALLLQVWTGLEGRPTRDIDLLGPLGLEPERLKRLVMDCAQIEEKPDGWVFDHQTTTVQTIRESATYMGLRATFDARLGKSKVRMQLDVGSGDEVVPRPSNLILPTLLDQPAPDLLCYSPCTSIAEKLDAIILLGVADSRMKDYFDIAYLSRCMEFSGADMRNAIASCCERRGTVLSADLPDGLTEGFAKDELARTRWQGFVKKSGLEDHAGSWAETVVECRDFLLLPLSAAQENSNLTTHWPVGGPWVEST